MSNNVLFPTFDVPELIIPTEAEEERYKQSVSWDMEKGDFVLDGASRMTLCSGKDAYIQWCHKMILTERYCCMAYPDYIGTEMEETASQSSDKVAESMMERTISEALMINPRTEYVRDFSFYWKGDNLYCEFTVKGYDWEEFRLSADITKKEVIENDS